jgi:hypothetical protein
MGLLGGYEGILGLRFASRPKFRDKRIVKKQVKIHGDPGLP